MLNNYIEPENTQEAKIIFRSTPNNLSDKKYFLYFMQLLKIEKQNMKKEINEDFIKLSNKTIKQYSLKEMSENEEFSEQFFQNKKEIKSYIDKFLKERSYIHFTEDNYNNKLAKCLAAVMTRKDINFLNLKILKHYKKCNKVLMFLTHIWYIEPHYMKKIVTKAKKDNFSLGKYIINFQALWDLNRDQIYINDVFSSFKELKHKDKKFITKIAKHNKNITYKEFKEHIKNKNFSISIFVFLSWFLNIIFFIIFQIKN